MNFVLKKFRRFWHRKLILKVWFWHFLTNHNSSQDCFKTISFEHVDWANILHFRTHHLSNSRTELTLMYLCWLLHFLFFQISKSDTEFEFFMQFCFFLGCLDSEMNIILVKSASVSFDDNRHNMNDYFFNFSCMFLNPNIFFQFEF